jgi:hypothetical protein
LGHRRIPETKDNHVQGLVLPLAARLSRANTCGCIGCSCNLECRKQRWHAFQSNLWGPLSHATLLMKALCHRYVILYCCHMAMYRVYRTAPVMRLPTQHFNIESLCRRTAITHASWTNSPHWRFITAVIARVGVYLPTQSVALISAFLT